MSCSSGSPPSQVVSNVSKMRLSNSVSISRSAVASHGRMPWNGTARSQQVSGSFVYVLLIRLAIAVDDLITTSVYALVRSLCSQSSF